MPPSHPPGFYWHVHHDILFEYCYSYEERARFIRTEKDPPERPLRLRLFQPVRGPLPRAVTEAQQPLIKAGQADDKAGQALNKAGRAYIQAGQANDDARQAYIQVGQASARAWQAFNKARQSLARIVEDNLPAIEALHAQECPDCPWNGKTIFPAA